MRLRASEEVGAARFRLLQEARIAPCLLLLLSASALRARSRSCQSAFTMLAIRCSSSCEYPKIRQAIEFHFKTAKQLAPSDPFPSLYLGHFYFDEGRYAEALSLFQRVDENYFNDIGQRWRILKNRELILCCQLYLGHGDRADSELEAICMVYEKADEEDRPAPLEIVTCVATLTNISQEKKRTMARIIIELIRRILAVRRRDRELPFAYPPLISHIFFTEALNEICDSI